MSFDENQAVGTVLVSSITTVDPDSGDYPTFKLIRAVGVPDDGSEVSAAFSVHPRTGAVTLQRALLDFEYQKQYLLSLTVTDQGVVRTCVNMCECE